MILYTLIPSMWKLKYANWFKIKSYIRLLKYEDEQKYDCGIWI